MCTIRIAWDIRKYKDLKLYLFHRSDAKFLLLFIFLVYNICESKKHRA